VTNPPYEPLGEVSQSSNFHNLFCGITMRAIREYMNVDQTMRRWKDGIPSIPRNVKILETKLH
jgi:hypothetical protein